MKSDSRAFMNSIDFLRYSYDLDSYDDVGYIFAAKSGPYEVRITFKSKEMDGGGEMSLLDTDTTPNTVVDHISFYSVEEAIERAETWMRAY